MKGKRSGGPKTLLRMKAGNWEVTGATFTLRRNIITFKFQVTPGLIKTTGISCWDEEVFSQGGVGQSPLNLEQFHAGGTLLRLGLCEDVRC